MAGRFVRLEDEQRDALALVVAGWLFHVRLDVERTAVIAALLTLAGEPRPTGPQARMLAALAGGDRIGVDALADAAGTSTTAARRTLAALEGHGWLHVDDGRVTLTAIGALVALLAAAQEQTGA